MSMTSNKNSLTLPMYKNVVIDPCDSLISIQLPNTSGFEQSMISCISKATNSDKAPPPKREQLQGLIMLFHK